MRGISFKYDTEILQGIFDFPCRIKLNYEVK